MSWFVARCIFTGVCEVQHHCVKSVQTQCTTCIYLFKVNDLNINRNYFSFVIVGFKQVVAHKVLTKDSNEVITPVIGITPMVRSLLTNVDFVETSFNTY